MNAMKISIALPLMIVLFVYGVYCPGVYRQGAHTNDLPSNYTLNSCISHSRVLELHSSSSTYVLDCGDETPDVCTLIESSSSFTTSCPFRRADVNFITIMEEEMNLITRPSLVSDNVTWDLTCYFRSATQAQQFYKLITRDRHSQLVHFARANYLKNSDNIVLAERPNLYSEGEGNVTIVVKNDVGDVAFIFEKDSVTEITQPEPTEIRLFIKSTNPSRRRLYKLGFSSPAQAAALIGLLGELRQPREDSESASEQSESDSD